MFRDENHIHIKMCALKSLAAVLAFSTLRNYIAIFRWTIIFFRCLCIFMCVVDVLRIFEHLNC